MRKNSPNLNAGRLEPDLQDIGRIICRKEIEGEEDYTGARNCRWSVWTGGFEFHWWLKWASLLKQSRELPLVCFPHSPTWVKIPLSFPLLCGTAASLQLPGQTPADGKFWELPSFLPFFWATPEIQSYEKPIRINTSVFKAGFKEHTVNKHWAHSIQSKQTAHLGHWRRGRHQWVIRGLEILS